MGVTIDIDIPPEGNFDIDAGDGGGVWEGGDHLEPPKSPQITKQKFAR